MAKRLFDRQANLLNYLTSAEAIFREGYDEPSCPGLEGIDRALLHLEARFSHDKRMAKIEAVFPRTFEIVGAGRERIIHEFVASCRPTSISRLSHAQQFFEFLSARWKHVPPDPPYLSDTAACEFACERVLSGADIRGERTTDQPTGGSPGWVRRRREIVLICSAYDIRTILEHGDREYMQPRATRVAVAIAPGGHRPQVLELAPAVFALLQALEEWADPSLFCSRPNGIDFISDLTAHGLLETFK